MNNKENIKLLLIVGAANDIFIYNYAKWIKSSISCEIDVFEVYPSVQQDFNNSYYSHVYAAKGYSLPIPKGKQIFDNIVRGINLQRFLKGKRYDIIHSHWVVSPVSLQKHLKNHCRKLILTFWGGEFDKQTILYSNKLYRYCLNRLSRQVDCIVNNNSDRKYIISHLPFFKGTFKNGILGSSPLEELYKLIQYESKIKSKELLNMPTDKLVVLIGYSGKSIHRQIPIIKELHKYPQLKDKIHILAPMTRGASNEFITLVENELKDLDFSYTLIAGLFLTDEEVARIRNATDIALQLSEFDAFSNSIIECLCAKAILIYGNWLGYENHLPSSGFKGIEVQSVENGVNKLLEVVSHMDDYKEMTNENHSNGRNQSLWSECIKDWVAAYRELLA